jgi:hypothetical protein
MGCYEPRPLWTEPHIAANMQRGSLGKLRNITSRAGQRAFDPVCPCTRFVGQRSGDFSACICQRCSDFLPTLSLFGRGFTKRTR